MTESAEKLNNQAILYATNGSFDEAIVCFKRAITLQNDNYLLWFNLGITYRDSGDIKKAKDAIKTAYLLAPDNEEVIEEYANYCIALGEYNTARETCKAGLAINVCNSHFYNLCGVSNFKEENYEMAAEWFEQALFINPYYYDALINLRDTYVELKNNYGIQVCNEKIKELKNQENKIEN